MTSYRLGTLLAAIFGLGWSIAIGVTLGVWLPQLWGVEALFYEEAEQFLPFVANNLVSWRIFHVGTTAALLAILPLITHLSHLHPDEYKRPFLQTIGLTGGAAALLASLIDQFSTPYLAQIGAGNIPIGMHVWEAVEPFRDAGLKTISFLLLGVWLIWLAGGWKEPAEKRPRQISKLTGWAIALLGLIELLVPLPWKNTVGETGVAGFVLLLLPVWGFVMAHWFWQQELALYDTAESHHN